MSYPIMLTTPTTALDGIRRLTADGRWRTLWKIKAELWDRWQISSSEAAISARLRELRSKGTTVERKPYKQGARACAYRVPFTLEPTP